LLPRLDVRSCSLLNISGRTTFLYISCSVDQSFAELFYVLSVIYDIVICPIHFCSNIFWNDDNG